MAVLLPEVRAAGLLLALTAALLMPTAVSAQNAGVGSGMTMSDFDAARASFFNNADRNGDWKLSRDEIHDALGFTLSRLFDARDFDGDGDISYEEFISYSGELFLELDRNGDGILSVDEL